MNGGENVFGTFCGGIDQNAVQRMFNFISAASATRPAPHVHLLFQSAGGAVQDGVCLYNYFRSLPLALTLYNVGTVSSAAAIAYLGGQNRHASTQATFMLHRTYAVPQSADSERLKLLAHSVALDDDRIEAILRAHVDMPETKWAVHQVSDLWFTAAEALEYGLVTRIDEFAPPLGAQLFNI